jgi:hypothetical protein
MADKQDTIGWRRFMEGMVTRSIRRIQETYMTTDGSNLSPEKWTVGVVTKLLEATHRHWLYRCIQIHDRLNVMNATLRKEELHEGDRVSARDGYGGFNGGRLILGGGQPGGPGKLHRQKTRILVSSDSRGTGCKYITGGPTH